MLITAAGIAAIGIASLSSPTAKDEAAPSAVPDSSDVAAYVRYNEWLSFARGKDSIYSAADSIIGSMGLDIRRPKALLEEYGLLDDLQDRYRSLMRRYPDVAFKDGIPRNVLESMPLIEKAAAKYKVKGSIIAAILVAESDGYKYAVNKAQNGRGRISAFAAGQAGINIMVHRTGGDPARIFETEENVNQCGMILSHYVREANGDMRRALSRYSGNGYDSYGKRYARKVLDLAAAIEKVDSSDSFHSAYYALR